MAHGANYLRPVSVSEIFLGNRHTSFTYQPQPPLLQWQSCIAVTETKPKILSF